MVEASICSGMQPINMLYRFDVPSLIIDWPIIFQPFQANVKLHIAYSYIQFFTFFLVHQIMKRKIFHFMLF